MGAKFNSWIKFDFYGIGYLENPKAASCHLYFNSAAAPASGNIALTFCKPFI